MGNRREVLTVCVIGLAAGTALGWFVPFKFSTLMTITPIVLLVLSLAYTGYWHGARSRHAFLPREDSEAGAHKARDFARVCGVITIALIAAVLILACKETGVALQAATGIVVGALASVAAMISFYVIGRGAQ